MHDTILLSKISEAVSKVCAASNIKKIKKIAIVVSNGSHVNENNLYDHLQYMNGDLVGEWTELRVQKEDILDQTAILHSIQGEQGE